MIFVSYFVVLILLYFRWIFFRNSVFGQECFRCCSIELVSDRCIVSRFDWVVEVKPMYLLLFSLIEPPKVHLNWYTLVFCKTEIEGEELLLITKLEVFIFVIVYNTFYFLLRSVGSIRGSLNKFPDFFRMGTFIDSTHRKLLSPSK